MLNSDLQSHLLTANTTTIADTVSAIKEDLVVSSPERPSCKAANEEVSSPQVEKVVEAMAAQAAAMATVMAKLEEMVSAPRGVPIVP